MANVYKDLSFSFKKHPLTGDLVTKTDDQAIKQSVKNLVKTRAYSRGFNVDIHSGIDDLLFENFTPILEHSIKREVENVLNNFEPRISIISVDVFSDNQNSLVITMKYKILNNDTLEQLEFVLEQIT